jgi:hypothetical protein
MEEGVCRGCRAAIDARPPYRGQARSYGEANRPGDHAVKVKILRRIAATRASGLAKLWRWLGACQVDALIFSLYFPLFFSGYKTRMTGGYCDIHF